MGAFVDLSNNRFSRIAITGLHLAYRSCCLGSVIWTNGHFYLLHYLRDYRVRFFVMVLRPVSHKVAHRRGVKSQTSYPYLLTVTKYQHKGPDPICFSFYFYVQYAF